MFGFVVKMEGAEKVEQPLPNAVRDEVIVAGLLMPMATTNLRALLRATISISDASEFGGSSAETKEFVAATDPILQKLAGERNMTLLEERSMGEQPLEEVSLGRFCCMCRGTTDTCPIKCPLGCSKQLCSIECYLQHRSCCQHSQLDEGKVLILSKEKEKDLVLALLTNGISVDLETPGRRKTPDAALVIALNRGDEKEAYRQLDALRNQRSEGRLAICWCKAGSKVWGAKTSPRHGEKSRHTQGQVLGVPVPS